MNYVPRMRFEMLCNGVDPEHIIRFSGTITARGDSDPAKWPNSEWRCLEVKWDALSSSDVLPPRVSLWEIQPLGRSMPFKPIICNIPFSRTNGNNQSGGLQSQGLTHSVFDIGSSSNQNEENMDDIDKGWKEFIRGKKLKAGDTCIFMKGLRTDEFYIGVKQTANPDTDEVFAKFVLLPISEEGDGGPEWLELFL
ncbi:auxin response factor 16-like [Bidens hawaiensis]|uniref:auxin response factor 16-like n=1 Tax=Bidens hawaiensis TaxID=980011 RepID=UPI00404B8C60